MRRQLAGLSVTFACALNATSPWADDIDIYLPGEVAAGEQACTTPVEASLVAGTVVASMPGRQQVPDAIYFALFETGVQPLWRGNVKKLRIADLLKTDAETGEETSHPIIAQAPLSSPPREAIDSEDGRILMDALTFWTDPAGADVVAFTAARGEVSGRDGHSAARGGAGQRIPGYLANTVGASNLEPGARQVFTLDPVGGSDLLALDTTADLSVLSGYLDATDELTPAQEATLVGWIRGLDAFDQDNDNDVAESRPWLLGDPLHSRPLAINYGARPGSGYTLDNPDLRLFFGSNDGVLHLIKNTAVGRAGEESGEETWAFIPLEMLAMQARLASGDLGNPPHPYGMDGEAVSRVVDSNLDGTIDADDGDSVWVYIGQRRGGRGLYAFDLTDPDNPAFKWQITHETPGFEQLGMTFSTPRVATVDLGVATQVLIFAGGYHGGWEHRGNETVRVGKDAAAGNDVIGNAIYVVNAANGELIWKAVGPDGGAAPGEGDQLHFVAGLTDSIPAPLTVVDADDDGTVDRAYAGDSGGNIWRVQLTGSTHKQPGTVVTAAANWFVTKLAKLGGGGADDRRFFHAPDYVRSRDGIGDYAGIVMVSGNRAAPRQSTVNNFAFLLKDRTSMHPGANRGAQPLITVDNLADVTPVCVAAAEAADCAAPDLQFGWKLALEAPGEKGLSTPLVSNGQVFFTSYLPAADNIGESCPPAEGVGRVYAVTLGNGSASLNLSAELNPADPGQRYTVIGAGIPGDVVPYKDRILIPGSGIDGSRLVGVEGPSRWRSYWREEDVDSP